MYLTLQYVSDQLKSCKHVKWQATTYMDITFIKMIEIQIFPFSKQD